MTATGGGTVLPAWLIETSCVTPVASNDTLTAPERADDDEFAATRKVAVPVPDPEVVPDAAMNEASDAALQAQPAFVVTVTLNVPPFEMKLVGLAETV